MQEPQELDHLFKLVAARVLTTIDMLHEEAPAQSEPDRDVAPASADVAPLGDWSGVPDEDDEETTVYAPREWAFYYRLADRLQSIW